jgi:type IV pilus assembly protein PilO
MKMSLSELRRRYGATVCWYSAGAAALALICAALCIELSLGFLMDGSEHQSVLGVKRVRLESISSEVRPLRGLGKDIGDTRNSIAQFYSDRVPASYSQIVSSLGDIAIRSGVNLSHVAYAQGTPGSDLSEVSMEVAVAGDYAQLVRFVNGIERDRLFFVIRALSFTGQQGGDVTLHLRTSTWMRSRAATDPLISSARPAMPAAPPAAMSNGGK